MLSKQVVAKILGGGAGIGALLAAGVHQGFGGPETAEVLARAQGEVSPLMLAQVEAAWIAGTLTFVGLGVGLIAAALKRPGWLYSLGWAACLWFGGVAAAFVYAGPKWGEAALAPQVVLLALLAGLASVAAALTAPKRG